MTEIIGKTENEAKTLLLEQGQTLRVIEKDGEPYIFTADYWDNRVNVKVEENKVLEVIFVG